MSQDTTVLPIPLQNFLASQRAKLEWLRYRTGQPLLQADRLPHQVMFIAEGAVRLIADDPATGPFTLARLGSGDALGWCGLLRNRPCEAAIAMEPTLVAALPAKQFLNLLPLEKGLAQGCLVPDRSELADLLLAWIARQPHRYDDLPGLLAELWRPGALQLLTGDNLQQARSLDAGWLWLPSTPLTNPAPEGTPLERWSPDNASADLPLGARLLGIKRAVLEEALAARRTSGSPSMSTRRPTRSRHR